MTFVTAKRDYGLVGPATSLVNATIIGIVICLILVINRIFWRFKTVNTVGIDDYFIIASMSLLIILGIISLLAVGFGYGRSQRELSIDETKKALLMFYLYQIVYKINIACTKLSVITLYLRIFHDKLWFRHICTYTALLVSIYTLFAVIINIFECRPIQYAWNKHLDTNNPGKCINITAFWLTTATINLSTELIILLASLFVVVKLDLPTRQKIALVAILLLGCFVFITSILRVTTLHPNNTATAQDLTKSTYRSTVWSTVEATTAITCACLPMLRTPIQRWLPRLFGRLSSAGRSRLTDSAAAMGITDSNHDEHRSKSVSTVANATATSTVPTSTKPQDHKPGIKITSASTIGTRTKNLNLSLSLSTNINDFTIEAPRKAHVSPDDAPATYRAFPRLESAYSLDVMNGRRS